MVEHHPVQRTSSNRLWVRGEGESRFDRLVIISQTFSASSVNRGHNGVPRIIECFPGIVLNYLSLNQPTTIDVSVSRLALPTPNQIQLFPRGVFGSLAEKANVLQTVSILQSIVCFGEGCRCVDAAERESDSDVSLVPQTVSTAQKKNTVLLAETLNAVERGAPQ